MEGQGTTPQSVCAATAPVDFRGTRVNPLLPDDLAKKLQGWQLVKLTRRAPKKVDSYVGRDCLLADATSGYTCEDIFLPLYQSRFDILKKFATVDFRGTILPVKPGSGLSLDAEDPDNYKYVWLPRVGREVPPEVRDDPLCKTILSRMAELRQPMPEMVPGKSRIEMLESIIVALRGDLGNKKIKQKDLLAPAFVKRALAAEDPAKSVTDDFSELEISSSVLQRIFGVNVPRAKKLQGLSKAMRRRAFNAVIIPIFAMGVLSTALEKAKESVADQ